MLTENELATLMTEEKVLAAMMELKKDFLNADSSLKKLSDDDFISLVMLGPSIGMSLANGAISLFEELSLNRKAQSLSNRKILGRDDPFTGAMKYLIKNFSDWEERIYGFIKVTMYASLKESPLVYETLRNPEAGTNDFNKDLLNAPYILVKFISFLFTAEENELASGRSVSKIEHQKITDIGAALGLGDVPVFRMFCDSFDVR